VYVVVSQDSDPCVKAMTEETEEGKKVARGGGKKYVAVFRRKANEDVAIDNIFW
jgi:tRNA (guanine-N7-)-methyltransferase